MSEKGKKWQWLIWIGLSLIVAAGLFASQSSASELPRGMVIADSDGVTIDKEGTYFIDIPDVLPGATYTKEITLRSTDEKEPFELGLRVHPNQSKGKIDFNEHVMLTLTLDGKELYQGKVLGDGKKDWSLEALSLGRFQFGTDKVLKAVFVVDPSLKKEDFAETNTFLYEWEFIATRNEKPVEPEKEKPKPLLRLPETGEEWREFLYQFLAGLLLVLIALLLWKRNKQEKKESQTEGERKE